MSLFTSKITDKVFSFEFGTGNRKKHFYFKFSELFETPDYQVDDCGSWECALYKVGCAEPIDKSYGCSFNDHQKLSCF